MRSPRLLRSLLPGLGRGWMGSGRSCDASCRRRVLSDPCARVVVVEHRDRLACFGVEHLEAAVSAQGRRIVVADPGETTDDLAGESTDDGESTDGLVRGVIEVFTGMCVRLYGRRGAGNR